MFSRRERLKKELFPAVLATGRRISSAHFKVIIPQSARGYAVVVPKKVARLSVTRHRIKRHVLSALRSLPALPPSLVLFPQPSVAQMRYQDIEAELARVLSKIK